MAGKEESKEIKEKQKKQKITTNNTNLHEREKRKNKKRENNYRARGEKKEKAKGKRKKKEKWERKRKRGKETKNKPQGTEKNEPRITLMDTKRKREEKRKKETKKPRDYTRLAQREKLTGFTGLKKDKKRNKRSTTENRGKSRRETGDMEKKKIVFLILIVFILAGCSGRKVSTKTEMGIPPVSNPPYTLGPLDKIMVKVWECADVSDTYSIDARGMIRFPLAGEVNCLGFTTYELADLLEEELIRYVRAPQVRVEVLEYNSQKVIIMGAVGKQGIYYVKSRLTIMEAIALAGGFQKEAKNTQVFIGRGEIGNLRLLKVNVKEIMVKGKKNQDILLQSGDIVFVPTTFIGNVNKVIKDLEPALNIYNTLEDIFN